MYFYIPSLLYIHMYVLMYIYYSTKDSPYVIGGIIKGVQETKNSREILE